MASKSCPQCGADFSFRSRFSVYGVCVYCQQMLVRDQSGSLAAHGVMEGRAVDLGDEWNALQLGVEGRFDDASFRILGRLRQSTDQGVWDEWCLDFAAQGLGWLAQAQGTLCVSWALTDTTSNPATPAPPLERLAPGVRVELEGRTYAVEEIVRARCSYSEGELPFAAPVGRIVTTVDCVGDQGAFAGLEYSTDGVRRYAGRYVQWDELKLRGLRRISGW